MTEKEFMTWLEGFIEAKPKGMSDEVVTIIGNKISTIITKHNTLEAELLMLSATHASAQSIWAEDNKTPSSKVWSDYVKKQLSDNLANTPNPVKAVGDIQDEDYRTSIRRADVSECSLYDGVFAKTSAKDCKFMPISRWMSEYYSTKDVLVTNKETPCEYKC